MATTPLTSGDHGHHVTPISVYAMTFVALLVLMGLTVGVSFVVIPDIGPIPGVWLNNGVALLIAVLKALLVIMFFMGVKYSSNLTKLWVVAGFVCLSIMFFILGDYMTRKYEVAPGWQEREGSALPRIFNPIDQSKNEPLKENIHPRP